MNSSFDGNFQFGWDNTSLSLLKECPRKYQYSMIENWRRKHTAAPLSFGGFFHRGLELYDRFIASGSDKDEATRQMIKAIAIETEIETTVFNSETLSETKVMRRYHTDDNRRNLFTLLRSLVWYLDLYQQDMFETIILPDGKPAVELSFRIELPFKGMGNTLYYCGHLDKAVSYNGMNWVLERKHTVQSFSQYYFDRFVLDSQPTGYSFALSSLSKGLVGGVIIDAAQVAINFTRFQRTITPRRPEQINEWLINVQHWINVGLDYANENYWPMNETSCLKYGKCQFFDVCNAPQNLRKNYLETSFKQEIWDPLKSRGEEADGA